MRRSGKGLTTSLTLRIKRRPKKRKNSRSTITENFLQDFMKLLEEFKDLPYIGYRKKQVMGERH